MANRAGLYYDPNIYNWSTPLLNSLLKGAQIGATISGAKQAKKMGDLEYKSKEIDLKNKENAQKATDEISDIAKQYSTDMQDIMKNRPSLATHPGESPQSPKFESPSAGLAYHESLRDEGSSTSLAEVQKKQDYDTKLQEFTTSKDQRLEHAQRASGRTGQFDRDVMNAYLKYGQVDKAQQYLGRHIEGVKSLAATNPKLAMKYAASGPMSHLIDGVDFDAKEKKWNLKMNDGSYILWNEKNPEEMKIGTYGKEKTPKMSSVIHNAIIGNNTEALFNFIKDESGRVVDKQQLTPGVSRYKGTGGGGEGEGDGKPQKWTAADITREYDKIAKEATDEDGNPREGWNNVFSRLPQYRATDMAAIKKGLKPGEEPPKLKEVNAWRAGAGWAEGQGGGTAQSGIRTNLADKAATQAKAQSQKGGQPQGIPANAETGTYKGKRAYTTDGKTFYDMNGKRLN